MKDFPDYKTVKYYYSDKKTSKTFLFGESAHKNGIFGNLIGTLLLTEDGMIYFNQKMGGIIVPDSCMENRCVIPNEWLTNKGVEYAIKYQPYDFEDTWCKSHSMYSKDLWRTVYQDIRDTKINIALEVM
jgi:hypothetical protein